MPEIVQKDALEPPRGPWTPESLYEAFPLIAWREPVSVAVAGYEGRLLVCRTCVANLGLRAEDLAAILGGEDPGRRATSQGFFSREQFDEHMAEFHPTLPDTTVPPPGAVPPARGALPPLRKPPGV